MSLFVVSHHTPQDLLDQTSYSHCLVLGETFPYEMEAIISAQVLRKRCDRTSNTADS